VSSALLTTVAHRLESDKRLEPVVADLHARVSAVASHLGGRGILSGSALGHPVHPLLVSAPIGCFTSAMVADLLGHRDAARTFTGAGVLVAFPTAATGLSDWVDTADAERRVGFLHLVANLVGVSFYATSWWARRRGFDRRGRALGLSGAVVISAAGWLGGHLVYAMGVGVDTTAFEGGPTEWTEIARAGDSPPHHAIVDGVGLAVLEDQNGIPRVLADRCTHRGGPLSEGEVAGGCITCPWHGSRFDLVDGRVVRGPASEPQPVYEVRVTEDGIEVRRDEPRALRRNPV
jgi:nitrite reductase/ring-hydroxylating ferredoxin subunit/uncharacterized membrane protein